MSDNPPPSATMTHDYKRNGTTTLFAALNVLDGQVIGQCQPRHTYTEWLKFLCQIDSETSKGKTLHLIANNYATHPQSDGVAGKASALQHALHTDLNLVDEHGRALLLRHHDGAVASRRVHQRARTHRCN